MQSQATTTQTITQTTMPNPRNTSKTTKSSDPVSNTPLQSDHITLLICLKNSKSWLNQS